MSIEVACPACGGSIQIEDVSEVVACPLCQMHLEINPETNEPVLLTEDSAEEESENQDSEEGAAPEESVETSEVNTTTEEIESAEDATPDNDDADDEQNAAESPFAFLPGGNQTKSEKAKPVRPATNFSFLPGGNEDSEEVETETSEEAPEETLSSEVESVPEEASEAAASEETDTEESVSEASSAEETTTAETESAVDAPPNNEEQDNAEETPSFAFLPGGNQTKSKKAKPVQPATNFSFLPGGNENSEEVEAEALETPSEEAVPEVDAGTPEETLSAEVESIPEEASEAAASEETDTEESVSEASSAEETTTAETESAVDASPNNEEQDATEEASSFAFLPGGNQTKSEKAKPVQPATNLSFLPGGNENSEDVKPEAEALETPSEEAVPEVDSETPEETLSEEEVEVESVPEEAPEAAASEETDTEEATSEEMTTEEPDTEESATEENVSEEAVAEEMTTEETVAEETTVDESATEEAAEAETKTEESSPAEASSEPESPVAQQNYRKGKVVPKRLFTLTFTYAIAATILVAMLLYAKYLGDPHQLESLPDLKPPVKNDEIALQLVPENAKLPAGHTLKLGGPGRRFGNVLVTPLRVTRGPVEFEHYTGDSTKTREPSQDVLKLHLKFENVSRDQTFEPLDQKLLLTRVAGRTSESQMRANNFVCRIDQKRTDAERVLVYDMPPSWDWNLKGQNINQEAQTQNLEPGESFETYVATNEAGIDTLKGDLVWRIQLRKGYNPVSYRGVTTLIEVVFNSDQIQGERPSKKKEPLPTS